MEGQKGNLPALAFSKFDGFIAAGIMADGRG
jgi:hypothetical protein